MPTVLVADDDARVRRGLREMIELSVDLTVVGVASSAREALGLDLALRPDVVLLDLLLPRAENGMAALRELCARGTPVVAISVCGLLRAAALAGGASSFVEKGAQPADDILRAILTARSEDEG